MAGRSTGPSAYAALLNPVNEPNPSETSVPIPAASNPGMSTTRSLGPPRPVASIRITAAISGEAKMNARAVKLPAAPITISDCGGISRPERPMRSTATPAPSAISGPSGPSTRPNPTAARPARMTPGSTRGLAGPPAARPFAGMCPPSPGSSLIANATSTPAMPRTTRYHHFGGPF